MMVRPCAAAADVGGTSHANRPDNIFHVCHVTLHKLCGNRCGSFDYMQSRIHEAAAKHSCPTAKPMF